MKVKYDFNKYRSNEHTFRKTPKSVENLCINNMDGIFKTKCNIDNFDLSQNFWKQINVNGTLSTSYNKPLIKEVISINAKVEVVNQKVLKAPNIMNLPDFEGIKGGQRIIKVEGLLCFSVNYISFSKNEVVHTLYDKIPFATVINLPLADLNGNDFLNYSYIISGCIEDVSIKSLVDSKLNLSVILVLSAFKSFNKDNCSFEEYSKNSNTDCNDETNCTNCTYDNEILTKGIFPQEKIETILSENQQYRKRITSTDIFKIPKFNPGVVKILSLKTNIKILCQRVVKTPAIEGKNLENKKLTGFILLVDYMVEYHIKYSSTTCYESVHSTKFEVLNSFYITVPDTTLLTDKFKIFYYIDDIYACLLNEREIFKSISIIFHTKPISCKPKPINILTFKGQNDIEIVTISIHNNLKLFKVNSSGETANPDFGEKDYFSFELIGVNKNLLLTINGDKNADIIENSLHNKPFEYGDVINLTYRERQRVSISNYNGTIETIASEVDAEYHPKYFSESYMITPDGLNTHNPNVLPNVITIKGYDNREVSIIRFNIDDSTLIVGSSGLEANEDFSDEIYFSFEVNDINHVTKLKSEMLGNEDGDKFRSELNTKGFEYGDILTVTYKESNRVIITNYESEAEYSPKGIAESYEITINGLKPIANILDENIITFNGKDDNEVAKIKFNFNSKSLLVTSTNIQANTDFENKMYFSFELASYNGNQKRKVIVNGNQNANNLKSVLNNLKFEEGDLINLKYRERIRVIISNYEGETQYYPKYFSESYRISNDSLEPNNPSILSNIITFKGKNNREVSIVRFNRDSETLIVESSGLQANSDFLTDMYFSIQIKDAFNKDKIKNQVQGNEDADAFSDSLNNFKFMFGDILILGYRENTNVFITNYEGILNYNPKGNSESYEITPNGLKPIININESSISINGSNQYGGHLHFSKMNFFNNKLLVSSTSDPIDIMFSGLNVFQLIIKTSGLRTKNSLYVKGEENSEAFKNTFNDNQLIIGDILRFRYIRHISLTVENFLGYTNYTLPHYSSSFQITPTGLKPYNFNLFEQTIILNRAMEIKEVLFINFAKGLKIFANPTGAKINALKFRNIPYFTFTLKNKDKREKYNLFINGNENAIKFSNSIDEQSFAYDDILRLKYRDNSMVIISNFNNEKEYHPKFYSERYVVKRAGLELLPNMILNNIITLKDKNNNDIIIIRFDVTELIFILDSSGITANTDFGGETYFSLTLKGSDNSVKLEETLKGNENGDEFISIFDEKSFEVGNIVTLTYKDTTKVDITNIKGEAIYHPLNNKEGYLITKYGLVPLDNMLPNIIAFRGRGGSDITANERRLMVTIAFDKNTMKLIVDSTGRFSELKGSSFYFSVTLLNSNGEVVNISSVNTNETANDFANNLNELTFEYNGSIILKYADSSRTDISNFDGTDVYHPTGSESSYTITPLGLMLKN